MTINVEFHTPECRVDEESSRTGSVFEVWWEHGGEVFPESHWLDFGAIVLGWWLVQFTNLITSGFAEFRFMDGPYLATGTLQHDRKHISFTFRSGEQGWSVSVDQFRSCLAAASGRVIAELKVRGAWHKEIAALERGLARVVVEPD